MEKKIIDYDLACANSRGELVKLIKQSMQYYWVPFGSPSYTLTKDGAEVFCQALVKYSKL